MRRSLLLCLIALAASAFPALAQLNLATNDCGGASSAAWTCTTNTGIAVTAVASITVPAGLVAVTGEEATLEVGFPVPVPPWWKVGAGQCRPVNAATVSYAVPPSSYNCVDYFGSVSAVVGSNTYQIGPDAATGDPNGPIDAAHVRIRTISAVDHNAALVSPQPMAGDEVFLFSVAINKSATVGIGSCPGCVQPACMALRRVKLSQPVGVGDLTATSPACIILQGYPYPCFYTKVGHSTWGQIKTLYR
jgi:hypothetical protein